MEVKGKLLLASVFSKRKRHKETIRDKNRSIDRSINKDLYTGPIIILTKIYDGARVNWADHRRRN